MAIPIELVPELSVSLSLMMIWEKLLSHLKRGANCIGLKRTLRFTHPLFPPSTLRCSSIFISSTHTHTEWDGHINFLTLLRFSACFSCIYLVFLCVFFFLFFCFLDILSQLINLFNGIGWLDWLASSALFHSCQLPHSCHPFTPSLTLSHSPLVLPLFLGQLSDPVQWAMHNTINQMQL